MGGKGATALLRHGVGGRAESAIGPEGPAVRPHPDEMHKSGLRGAAGDYAGRCSTPAAGKEKKKVEPWPTALSAQTLPPWRATIRRTLARPMPVPS